MTEPHSQPPSSRVTLRHIAAETGYTIATVSMALRNRPGISAATRQRIQQVARRMGYAPDPEITKLMYRLRSERDPAKKAALAYVTMFSQQERRQNRHLGIGFEALRKGAAEYGYALEEFFLDDYADHPGSLTRVLRARGIEGVVLSGLPSHREPPPLDLSGFSVATIGYSRKIPIHRACQHQYADTRTLLARLRELGYRRPGLILPHDSDIRVNRHYTAAFRVFLSEIPEADRIEPCMVAEVNPDVLIKWIQTSRPDAVIFHSPNPETVLEWVGRAGLSVPRQLGLAALDLPQAAGPCSGMVQNLPQVARAGIDLVVNQIMRDQRGFPDHPRIVMVEGAFHMGETLRRCRR
jgi:LacI family transcriptional regulator